jgi:hypothetical protein
MIGRASRILLVFLALHVCIANTELVDIINKEKLRSASETFATQKEVANTLVEFIKSKESLKSLQKLTGILTVAGPAFMVFSGLLSIASLLAGSPESEELIAVKAGFEKMEAGISSLKFQLDEVSFLISYKAAQTVYQKDANIIYNLYDELFRDNRTAKDEERFLKNYEARYDYATKNLWRYMVNEDSTDLNLFDSYRDFSKCNTYKVQAFCLRMVHRINKGQAVEGHYYAITKDQAGLHRAKEEWTRDMDKLLKRCDTVVKECSDQWQKYAQNILDSTYNEHYTESNQNLADQLYAGLTEGVPQRMWAVWVYNQAATFSEHTIMSPEFHLMKWHKNDKTVTVAGYPEETSPLTADAFAAVKEMGTKETSSNCNINLRLENLRVDGPYLSSRDLAKKVTELVEQTINKMNKFPDTLVYTILKSKNVVFRAAPSRGFQFAFEGRCVIFPMNVYLFR